MLGMVSMRAYRVTDGPTVLGFLHDETWPFHAGPAVTLADAAEHFDPAAYASDAVESWWLDVGEQVIGLVRLFDLCDDTAMFDIRISQAHRRTGVGTSTVRWLTEHIFTTRSCKRIEATTRQDNIAMRRVLLRCGYAKEAHYRAAWPAREGNEIYDAVGYAILDNDWRSGTVTPVVWNDEPDH
jgi:RimJ/RimL family protein N-acetyltransferase